MIEQLAKFLTVKMPGARQLRITDLRQHTEGFSLETFSFTATWKDESGERKQRYVIRREPPAGLLEPYDLEPQFRVLQALADTPVIFPRVFWFERDPQVLGAPFYVMEWVEGEVPLPALDEGGTPPFPQEEQRLAVARDYCSILAEIHKVDWKEKGLEFLGVPASAREAASRAVEFWAGYAERSRLAPMPVMTEALCWLRNNLPGKGPVTIVHGDYRTGNFMVRNGRIVAFLDWELVHLGDPMEDLAWSVSRIWRGESPYAGYLADREELFTWYREAGGAEVDLERVHFYEVLAGVKMAAIMLTGIKAWHDRRTTDMRMGFFDQQVAGMYAIIAEALGLVEMP